MKINTHILAWIAIFLLYQIMIESSSNSISAQSFIPSSFSNYYFSPQNLGFSTPQTAELIKYNKASVDYYNGLLDLEIPILDFKNSSFSVPITLKYLSDGFKPGRRPSLIGNNWGLNVGGVITRNVFGSPDDVKGYKETRTTGKYLLDGLLVAIRNNTYRYYAKTELYDLNIATTTAGNPYVSGDIEYDYAPDIFSFSFGEHKGSFFIGNNGQVVLSLGDGYKVDISGMAIQEYSTTASPANSIIKIITPDGCVYEFGGDTSYLEYNIPNNPSGMKINPVQITSWHLKSAYNANTKKTMYFKYKNYEQKNKYNLFLLDAFNQSTIRVWQHPNYSGNYPPTSFSSDISKKQILVEDKLLTPILEKITIDNIEIKFNVGKFPVSFWGEDNVSDLLYLEDITLTSSGSLVRKSSFDYLRNGRYFFMKSLKINNQSAAPEVYLFDYNLNNTRLPEPLTIATDHWGFWNGGYETSEEARTYLINVDRRKTVNINTCNLTMLNKITHPTKGETLIIYEHNRYNYWKVKSENSILWKTNFSQNSIPCGGVRVKSITDCDLLSNKNIVRTFSYISPDEKTGSGIIGVLPKYMMPVETIEYFNVEATYKDKVVREV
ncbi:hypothetical protein [Bacteroides reticulotermitis]|uniref:Uncharacterized protein n=2 Tax=Bacteroides reticulotermitis TaxID=1133319 RepID=W4UQG1_9BACE|nr:hypothetical protein [Bacteroides reticulotermitis]MBB4044913.1 hypothetical protein [Bacteroides reticulotermitis]GAE82759.1 hypothetical protein JCM10512_989 [Bacteroides reticulotermitis JCM 10512]